MLEEELGLREGRRFRNALKLSGLPHHKTLNSFEFAFQPDLDARHIRDLAALGFVRTKSNIALLGPPGVGKTHLAIALAVAACQAGLSIYYTTLDDLVRQLREAERTGRFAKKLQTYLKPSVLVVDEVGYLPLDRASANMVFQLVSRRYERDSIILTSNKAFSDWGQVFTDDVLATAILDRLLHHCDVVSINGPSYRLKDHLFNPTHGAAHAGHPRSPCGRSGDPLYGARQTLHTGIDLLTDKQTARLSALFGRDEHVQVEATWRIYQRMITAYRDPDRAAGLRTMHTLIDALSNGVPAQLTELITLGRTLKRRATDVLAYFTRPSTSNGPTEAINGRLEHLRGSALGFRNLTNYIARSLLEAGGFRPRLHPRL